MLRDISIKMKVKCLESDNADCNQINLAQQLRSTNRTSSEQLDGAGGQAGR